MAKNAVSDWDTNAANNTDVGGININTGMDPGNVDNAMREIMAQIAAAVGTDEVFQPFDADLEAIAGLTSAADKLPYYSGSAAAALADLTAYARTLLDDADAGTARTTLGLGTIATQDADSVTITGGSITGITDLAIADGGTGASTAANARTALGVPNIAGDTFTGDVSIRSADGGASQGPTLTLDRNSASPAASDVTGSVVFTGRNSAAETIAFAAIRADIESANDGTEGGLLRISTVQSGTAANRMWVGEGAYMQGATDQGAGTFNATGLYVSGTAVKTDYGVGDGQTWQDVSGSRAEDTSYQNTTGKPIQLAIRSAGGDLEVSSNGSTWLNLGTLANGFPVIPNNYYYRFSATFSHWAELR